MCIKATHIQIKEIDANQLNQHLRRLKENWMYSLFTPWTLKKVTGACLYSWVHPDERSIHSSQLHTSSGLEAKKPSSWHFFWSDTPSAGHILRDTGWSWHHYTALQPELAYLLSLTFVCLNNLSSPLQTPLSLSLYFPSIHKERELHFPSPRKPFKHFSLRHM